MKHFYIWSYDINYNNTSIDNTYPTYFPLYALGFRMCASLLPMNLKSVTLHHALEPCMYHTKDHLNQVWYVPAAYFLVPGQLWYLLTPEALLYLATRKLMLADVTYNFYVIHVDPVRITPIHQ